MTKEDFFDFYYKYLNETVYLTDTITELNEEISHNCWHLSIPEELLPEVNEDEILEFIIDIKEHYKRQLRASPVDINLLFYLWVDEQAGQLRFNFINSNHEKLPFGCVVRLTEDAGEIVRQYIGSPNKYDIVFSDLTEADNSGPEHESKEYVLNVYSEIIPKRID